jgi:uncharacterized membrane protein
VADFPAVAAVLAAAVRRAGGDMNKLTRILKHLSYPDWWMRRVLPPGSLRRIEKAVAASEAGHGGEIRVAFETSLGWLSLFKGQTTRERAEDVFSRLRVWDTEDNNGVLIYMLLADRQFEIVADRGVAHVVGHEEWARLCSEMEARFRSQGYEVALLYGIQVIGQWLQARFPRLHDDVNELPDRPMML